MFALKICYDRWKQLDKSKKDMRIAIALAISINAIIVIGMGFFIYSFYRTLIIGH